MKVLIFAAAVLLVHIPVVCSAASDNFTVGMQVIGDLNPPSAPSAVVAIPSASSQIELSWTAATDDVALGGYTIFRDALQIATTTLTTYTDTGLAPSTLYTYFVKAFDTSYNISTSSNTAATTTLAATVPSDNGSQTGSIGETKLLSLDIQPDIHAATFTWKTNRFMQFELRWGRTPSYELGFVSNELFKKEHSTIVTGLDAGTAYMYELVAYDHEGDRVVLSGGTFKTSPAPDQQPPSNVGALSATIEGSDIHLTWGNPTEKDFSYVRIVRSHLFYPSDPSDGYIAYQGEGEIFIDEKALAIRPVQYYTVFSYDQMGNVSSGATIRVTTSDISDELSPSFPAFPLDFNDIEVLQDGVRITNGILDAKLPTVIRIAYEKLPEHLKVVRVELTDPHDPNRTFSFLLRINSDKTYYEATLGALLEPGIYPVIVSVFDFQTQLVQQVTGTWEYVRQAPEAGAFTDVFTPPEEAILFTAAFVLFGIFLLLYLHAKNIATKKVQHAVPLYLFLVLLLIVGISVYGIFIITEGKGEELVQSATVVQAAVALDPTLGMLSVVAILFVLFLTISLFKKR